MTEKRVLTVAFLLFSCGNNGVPIGDRVDEGASGSAGDPAASGTGGSGQGGSGSGGKQSGGTGQGGSSMAGTSASGSSSGGSPGTGGTTAGSGAGGAAGAPSCDAPPGGCCWIDADCDGLRCYDGSCETGQPGRCAMPPAGGCFADRDCPPGETCRGGQLAPCGSLGPDSIGTCGSDPCPVETTCVGGPGCQCLLAGQGCVVADGPQGNGNCRGDDGVCFACECASPDTPIATPNGERPLAELREGDLVYSVHGSEIRAVPIARVHRVPVSNHRVLRLTFAGGGVIEMSAGHPTADGRALAALRRGDDLAGATVLDVQSVPYAHAYTYDILPASESGAYFASGVLVGSTLARLAPPADERECRATLP